MENVNKNDLTNAKQILSQLIPLVEQAEDKFRSARNWGFIDMVGGGFFVNMIKHYKINSAGNILEDVQYLLEQLQNVLKAISIPVDYRVRVGGFATFADFVFDGFISDSYMQFKIMGSLDQIRELKKRLLQLDDVLREML